MIKRSALMAVTGVAALVSSAAPALAAEGNFAFSSDVVALMSTQAELHKIVDRIDDGTGFSGVYVDAPTKTLSVYWKGTAPAALRTEAVTAKAKGLTVKVRPATFTRAELRAESERIFKADNTLSSIGLKHDGSGLVAKTTSGTTRRTAVASSVPVEVQQSEQWHAAAGRYQDAPPFGGGAFIKAIRNGESQGICSTGFAVVDNLDKLVKGLTAAHCGSSDTTYVNGGGAVVGGVGLTTTAHDGAVIDGPRGNGDRFAAKVWAGDSITGTNQALLDVVSASGTLPGDLLCTSGALSGTICQIRAQSTGNWIRWGGGYLQDMVIAQHVDGYSAGGFGDSGGPVFSVAQPGDKLTARGTLTAVSTSPEDIRQCSGVPSSDDRVCSRSIIFPDITFTMSDLNVRIKTAA